VDIVEGTAVVDKAEDNVVVDKAEDIDLHNYMDYNHMDYIVGYTTF
jgi:hypothetical protein